MPCKGKPSLLQASDVDVHFTRAAAQNENWAGRAAWQGSEFNVLTNDALSAVVSTIFGALGRADDGTELQSRQAGAL